MLKPSSTKIAEQDYMATLIAQFKSDGGAIVVVEPGVALGLKRKKFIKKTPKPD
jgi:hypothetical protein